MMFSVASANLKQYAVICDQSCIKRRWKHVGKAGNDEASPERQIVTLFFLVSLCWFTMAISHSLLYNLNDSSSIQSRTRRPVWRGSQPLHPNPLLPNRDGGWCSKMIKDDFKRLAGVHVADSLARNGKISYHKVLQMSLKIGIVFP